MQSAGSAAADVGNIVAVGSPAPCRAVKTVAHPARAFLVISNALPKAANRCNLRLCPCSGV